MEKEAKWLCDCGRTYIQPQGNAKFPIREKCDCGKDLFKIQAPDGVVEEFAPAEEWFLKEFDEQNKKMSGITRDCNGWAGKLFTAQEMVTELRGKFKEENKKMQNIVEAAARRHKDHQGTKLSRRLDHQWRFHRGLSKWVGVPKPKGGADANKR